MLESQQEYLKLPPYSLDKNDKREQFTKYMNELTRYHYQNSAEYQKMLNGLSYSQENFYQLEDLPMLPIGLFKEYELCSVPKDKIVRTMKSSGTSGQKQSKVLLDTATTRAQTRCLSYIIADFIGNKRLPMIILDSEIVKKDPRLFSARGAGIIGFSMFGRDVFFALDNDMNLRVDELKDFIAKHNDSNIILFGYTYIVWKFFQQVLADKNIFLDIAKGFLFHIGGWKKLIAEAVTADIYRDSLKKVCGNIQVQDYYGMAEQLGSVFVECEHGHKHCSIFSDIITRRAKDFSACDIGEVGIIELMSVLPSSYPGHIILTEDEGRILGEDDCPCGRKGKYFEILGRVKQAEIRGCSDTYGQ